MAFARSLRPAAILAILIVTSPLAPVRADTPPKVAWQAYQAGQAALAREDFAGAETQFRLAIKEDRLLSLAHYGLGTALAATRRYQEAVDAFAQAIVAHREWLARQATEAGSLDQRRDEEIRELRDSIRAIESGTQKFTSSQEVIKLEQRIQQLEREKSREQTGAQGKVPAEFYVALGSAHHRLGHVDEARAAYEEALKVEPARGDAHNNLAALALARGDKDGAREHVRLAEAAGFRVNPDLRRDVGLDAAAAPVASAPAAPAGPAPPPAAAQAAPAATLTIEHEPLTCAAVGRSPFLQARVAGPEGSAQVRVSFSAMGSPYQYVVRMKREGGRYVTRLPKPRTGLASFTYSIDATDRIAASARTEEVTVNVAASAQECPAAEPPATRETLLVEIPAGAPSRPPVPDGFDDEGVKGTGGTKVGMTNVPAKLGALVGVAAVVGGTVAARGSIYDQEPSNPNVIETQLELLDMQPPAGSTLVAPNQPVQTTFRITVPQPATRLFLRVRLRDSRGVGCIEIAQARGPVSAGDVVEMTAAGPANAIQFCGSAFDVETLGVDVQADTDFLVSNRSFPASYKVVRQPGS